jgi:ElaB/YqjD/DUF883 family membrane-anchored ribosome-binding protein
MSSTEQLEREAEQTRARISANLNELRARMTPGQVVDQLVDYANDSSGGMFLSNLRQRVVESPMPVVLVGAGLAWLAMSSRRNSTNADVRTAGIASAGDDVARGGRRLYQQAGRLGDRASDTAEQWSDGAKATASEWGDTASEWRDDAMSSASDLGDRTRATFHDVRDKASAAAASAVDTASETYSMASQQARRAAGQLKGAASETRAQLGATTDSFIAFLKEQPFVLAGLGIALGAVVGALLPSTKAEDALMGEKSDALKEDTRHFADKATSVAERSWEAAKDEMEQQVRSEFGTSSAHDGGGASSEMPGDGAALVPDAGGESDEQNRQTAQTRS